MKSLSSFPYTLEKYSISKINLGDGGMDPLLFLKGKEREREPEGSNLRKRSLFPLPSRHILLPGSQSLCKNGGGGPMPPLWRKKGGKRFMGNGDEGVEVKNDPRRSHAGRVPASVFYFFLLFFYAGEFPFELSLLVRGPQGRKGGEGGECASSLALMGQQTTCICWRCAENKKKMAEDEGKRVEWRGEKNGRERGRRASFVGGGRSGAPCLHMRFYCAQKGIRQTYMKTTRAFVL